MKILLICSAGASTSVVVQRMQEEAAAQNKQYTIEALGISEAKAVAQEWDVLLLGPQVRNQVKQIQGLFPDKPCDSIPPIHYGRMDGKAVLELAESLVK